MARPRPPKVREDVLPERSEAAPPALANLEVVLVRPRDAANVGSCARALGNFGVRRLCVVGAPGLDRARAARRAVGAAWLVDGIRHVATLEEAVGPSTLAYATSGRPRRHRRAITPRQLAAEALPLLASDRVALVFGCEKTGLTEAETDACHAVVAIPADPAFRSLNVSHAVAILLYDLWCGADRSPRVEDAARYVDAAEQRNLLDHAFLTLDRIGFLKDVTAPRVRRTLLDLLGRTRLTPRELQTLEGILHRVDRAALSRGPGRGSTCQDPGQG